MLSITSNFAEFKDKCGVYKMGWSNNPYFYIGSAIKIQNRFIGHRTRMNTKVHKNPRLQSVADKYGLPDLLIPLEIVDKAKLIEREQFYIDKFFGQELCCNMLPNAESRKDYKESEETKSRKSISMKGKNTGQRSPEIIEKLRIKAKERALNTNGKVVLDLNTGVFYDSIKEVANLYRVHKSRLGLKLKGKSINNTNWILA